MRNYVDGVVHCHRQRALDGRQLDADADCQIFRQLRHVVTHYVVLSQQMNEVLMGGQILNDYCH